MGLEPAMEFEMIWRKYGTDGIRRLYKANLDIVLKFVDRLTEELSGRVVITSDHGELLGERGLWLHPRETDIPMLRNVPWFKVGS